MAAEHRFDYGSVRVRSADLEDGSGGKLVTVEATCVCGFRLSAQAATFVDASHLLQDTFTRHVLAQAGTSGQGAGDAGATSD
jgi:hypothetical protein